MRGWQCSACKAAMRGGTPSVPSRAEIESRAAEIRQRRLAEHAASDAKHYDHEYTPKVYRTRV
jgi:hypothetical protein